MSLEIENTQLKTAIADLQKQLSEKSIKAYEDRLTELTQKLDAATKLAETKAAEHKTAVDKLTEDVKAGKDNFEKMKKDKEDKEKDAKAAVEAKDKAEADLKAMVETSRVTARKSKVVAVGAPDKEADEFVKKYDALSEEAYADVIELAKSKWVVNPPASTPAAAAAAALNTSTKPAPEVIPTSEGPAESTRASIHEFIKNALVKKEK